MRMLKANPAFGGAPLVIAVSGNDSHRERSPAYRIAAPWPSPAEDFVAVAAFGQTGNAWSIADFSNTLALVGAPGVDMSWAELGKGMTTMSATRIAWPHVAGVAALWWESIGRSRQNATPKNVTGRLTSSARRHRFAEGVDEADVGHGCVTAPE